MKVTVDIDVAKILRERGLGVDNRAQVYLASEVKRLCDPYVPMQSGLLKNRTVIASDGSTLTYNSPYAHYQYYGKVMAGRAPKKYTGEDLSYSGAPMRGARWVERMLADKRNEIVSNMEKFIAKGG